MTNEEIIGKACQLSGITVPVHTFAEWKKLGYIVKKGEKARMRCDIWMKSNKKVETKDGEEKENDRFYKKLSYFFTADQVTPIQ